MTDANEPGQARDGHVWVCLACGRVAKNKYPGRHNGGWDEACMLNSVEVEPWRLHFSLDGRVESIAGEAGWEKVPEG